MRQNLNGVAKFGMSGTQGQRKPGLGIFTAEKLPDATSTAKGLFDFKALMMSCFNQDDDNQTSADVCEALLFFRMH